MHNSLLFTASLVLAIGSSAAAQDASCPATAGGSGSCQKASAVSPQATPVAAPVVVSDDEATVCCAGKGAAVAQGTLSDDEVAQLLREVRAALAEVQGAVQEATGTAAAALPAAQLTALAPALASVLAPALAGLGYVSTTDERGYMGISMQIGDGAMTIQEVMEGGGAAVAGLRAGDRILTIDGQSAQDAEALMAHLGKLQAGATVKVTYERDGKQRKAEIELSTLAAIESAGGGEQRELEKVEVPRNVIEWIEVGDHDDVVDSLEVDSEREHELRAFTVEGGNRRVHVIGADDLDLEVLEGLEGLLTLHGGQLKLEGLEGLKMLESLHLDLGKLGDLKGLQGNIRININGEDIDLSELENLGGIFEVNGDVDDEGSVQHKIEFHDIQRDSSDIRKRVIQRLGLRAGGGHVIHLRHDADDDDDDDDDDDSRSFGFFFSDDDDGDHEFKFEHRGRVIIKTQKDGSGPVVQEFTFGGEAGELPVKIRELLKRHGGMSRGFFVHEDGDHNFEVDIEAFMGGKGGNLRFFQRHDDDEDSDSDGNLFFFGSGDHEFPEVVRRMMKNRVLFSTEGGNWAWITGDDDDHDHAGHDDDRGVHVLEIDGGDWMDEFLVRINGRDGRDGRNLGRRIRERLQLREIHEHGEDRGNQGVRDLEHEVEALRDRIRELERAIERLGRRRR